MREIKIGGYYKHFKGDVMKVIGIAKHSETLEELVIYEHNNELWARLKEEFLSLVDKNKYPNVEAKYRFEEIKEED